MTCLFFGLLPTDVQIDILHVWLDVADDRGRCLLKVLSALDVACSSSEQPSLRYLMDQLPPFGRSTDRSSGRNTQHIASYLQWLSSRDVPLITLALTAHFDRLEATPDLMLPMVEALHWKGDDSSADLTSVLQHVLQHVLCAAACAKSHNPLSAGQQRSVGRIAHTKTASTHQRHTPTI